MQLLQKFFNGLCWYFIHHNNRCGVAIVKWRHFKNRSYEFPFQRIIGAGNSVVMIRTRNFLLEKPFSPANTSYFVVRQLISALKLGRSKRQVFFRMVGYFYPSKKDPIDLDDELLKIRSYRGRRNTSDSSKRRKRNCWLKYSGSNKNCRNFKNNQILKQNGRVFGNNLC